MSFLVSSVQLSKLMPGSSDVSALVDAINETLEYYKISDSPRRVRYFVAQSFFETQRYTKWSENLTYTTPERLPAVWPARFTLDKAQATSSRVYAPLYVNNPMALANLVYAGRYGNGDVNSGDGYSYRGRGAFHLTFKDNYAAYSKKRYGDDSRVQNPDLVAEPDDAFMSAGWFWDNNGLSAHADADEFTITTKIINGSDATVPQRLPVLNQVNSIFKW